MNLTKSQSATRELNSRMAFNQLANCAMLISHNGQTQIRLSNALAELQSDPATTYSQLCEVLADHILNELRNGYETL